MLFQVLYNFIPSALKKKNLRLLLSALHTTQDLNRVFWEMRDIFTNIFSKWPHHNVNHYIFKSPNNLGNRYSILFPIFVTCP